MRYLTTIMFCLLLPLDAFSLGGLWAPGMPLNPAIRQASQTSACYNITDSDARGFCIARVRRDVSQCYNIQRGGLRSMCLAEVRR